MPVRVQAFRRLDVQIVPLDRLLLLMAALALGLARALAAPPGYNVDEWARMPYILRQAACWRETFERSGAGTLTCWQAQDYRDNPAYYLLLSIPEVFALDKSQTAQYLIARLTTTALGLVTLRLAWLTCRELLPGREPLPLAVTAAAALNQSFGDIFSGVNSDAGAAFAIGVLVYALARFDNVQTFKRSNVQMLKRAGLVAAALWLCASSSESALWLGLPIFTVWLLARTWRPFGRWVVAAGIAGIVLAVAAPGGPVEWTAPQYWFDAGPTEILGVAERVPADGPLGPHALAVQKRGAERSYEEVQFLRDGVARQLAGKTVTFGGWLLAPAGKRVEGPVWDDGVRRVGRGVVGTGQWQFVAVTTRVDSGAQVGAIFLPPPPDGVRILFDGLIVAEGSYPADVSPRFDDRGGRAGTWGGRRFTNLLLNPSVEAVWPSLRTEGMPRDVIAYNGRLHSFLAWERTAAAYPAILRWLFAGFWSEFSGIHPGLSSLQLLPFFALTLAGLLGVLRLVLPIFSPPPLEFGRAVRFFLPIAMLVWLTVFLRADLWPNMPAVLSFAGARYAVAAVVPTMALIVLGALHWLPGRFRRAALALLTLTLWLAAVHILVRVQIPFYNCFGRAGDVSQCLTSLPG